MSEVRGAESVLVFFSTHHMLRAEQALLSAGIDIELVPAPKEAGELCTTAIRFYTDFERQVQELLAEGRIEVKEVLPYRRTRSSRRALVLGEIARMLDSSGPDGQAVIAEAEEVTGRAFGSRVSLMASAGIDGGGMEEARGFGIPLLLIPLSGEETPDAELLRSMLRDSGFIATAVAPALNLALVENLRSCGVHYFLTANSDPLGLSAARLAEELVFLRDNRPGLVGTGSLIPLVKPDAGSFQPAVDKIVLLAAVARLVIPDAYIPAPPWLWASSVPGCCNLVVVNAAAGDLKSSLLRLKDLLKEQGRRLPPAVEERCS